MNGKTIPDRVHEIQAASALSWLQLRASGLL